MFESIVSIHILGGDGGSAPDHPGFKLDVSLMPLGFKGVHESCVEWLVITMSRKVKAQVPG